MIKEAVRRLVFLFGPTGVGKTDLILELFAGKGDIAAEIISADSMQVYRHMDIGSAKPSPELRARLPHHLIDIRNPDQQFHAADFVTLSDHLIDDIAGSGKIPVVSGGTAFYFRTLLYGLPGTPSGNPSVRATILEREAANGLGGLYRELTVVDPDSARRISPNDRYRISRALEVYCSSGIPLSRYSVPAVPRSDLQVLILGLRRPREELYARIDARVNEMFQTGLSSEVEKLVRIGYLPQDPGFRGIGYREFFERYCEASSDNDSADSDRFADWVASLDDSTAAAIKERVKMNSRHYAKRQTTFFKRLPEVQWFDPAGAQAISDTIARFWEN